MALFGYESRWLDSLMGLAFATGGALWARPWWKAALMVAFGLGLAVWGYWRGPSHRERRRGDG
jgi:hypothetical protein